MSAVNEFVSKVKEGAYADKTNAQRAIGVWSRHNKWGSDAEVEKAKKFVEAFDFSPFKGKSKPAKKVSKKVVSSPGTATSAPKASKKVSKKVAKKVAKKVSKKVAKKKASKKVTSKAAAAATETPQGALDYVPSTVESVGDILRVVDSTVASGVKTLDALRQAKDLNSGGDIADGVGDVMKALTGVASILNMQVVAPLVATHSATPQDAEVAERLHKVVAATDGMNAAAAVAMGAPTAPPPPPGPPQYAAPPVPQQPPPPPQAPPPIPPQG